METGLMIWFYCIDCYVISFGNSILIDNKKNIFIIISIFNIYLYYHMQAVRTGG
jgi:hypothetical protein